MIKLFIRLLCALIISMTIAVLGLRGHDVILQSLFTVLGITFSISMSILISFDLSKVYNKSIRMSLRSRCRHILNQLILDFIISCLIFVLGLMCNECTPIYVFKRFHLDILLFSIFALATSLIYELYNFRRIQKLKDDIADRILDEESKL